MPPPLLASVPDLWTIVLPVVIGGLAVFLLLPRPQAYPVLRGALLGLLALILAGVFLVRARAATPEVILFYAFSAIAITSGTLLVTQRNPARAALSFALVVLSTCGLFLLLAAPFLMAATIIIYAGAIIVTFLFVIMLAQQEGLSDADARSREPLLATATGFVLLGTLLYVLRISYGTQDLDRLIDRTERAAAQDTVADINRAVGEAGEDNLFRDYKDLFQERGWDDLLPQVKDLTERKWLDDKEPEQMKETLRRLAGYAAQARNRLAWLQPPGFIPVSSLSGPPANTPPQELRRARDGEPQLPHDNSAYLGRSLFTDYLLPVELGGTLLLVATVGAIAIAYRRSTSSAAPGRPS